MVDIDKIKPEIIERLLPLKPDKIILFGSYANGTAREESDIDLFLLKDGLENNRDYRIDTKMRLLDLIEKYHTGFDVLSYSTSEFNNRDDYFFTVDLNKNGVVTYE